MLHSRGEVGACIPNSCDEVVVPMLHSRGEAGLDRIDPCNEAGVDLINVPVGFVQARVDVPNIGFQLANFAFQVANIPRVAEQDCEHGD